MKKHNIFYLLFFSLFIGCTDESLNISRIDRANNAPPASIIGIANNKVKKRLNQWRLNQTKIVKKKPK